MMNILDIITGNIFLFIIVIVSLITLLIVLIYFIKKTSIQIPIYEEDLDKDELANIRDDKIDVYEEDLENITDEELIERVKQENLIDEQEVIANSSISDIESILSHMHEDQETKPEEVVAKFEQEQEENSIISYQELVEMVKNNQNTIYDDEVAELPTTSSVMSNYNIIEEKEEASKTSKSEDLLAMIKQVVNNSKLDKVENIEENVIDNSDNNIKTSSKFKPDDFISPVFGRMSSNIQYTTIPKIDNSSNKYNLELGERTLDLEKLDLEIKRNEEFLQALKDFRNSL